MFKALINKVNKDIVSFLIKAGLPTQSAVQEDRHRQRRVAPPQSPKVISFAVITSGGKLKTIAEENKYNKIIIPGNQPPRAMFGYAFTELFFIMHYKKRV